METWNLLDKKELAGWGVAAILAASLIAVFFYRAPIIEIVPSIYAQPTTLNIIRPESYTYLWNQVSTNLYDSDSVAINFTVSLYAFWGQLDTRVEFSATVPAGQLKSVDFSFNRTEPDDTATVHAVADYGLVIYPQTPISLQNMTVKQVFGPDFDNMNDSVVSTVAKPNTNECYMSLQVYWSLEQNDVYDHRVNYVGSLVYQDRSGTIRNINIPIDVGLLVNSNNDFNTAKEIGLGLYNPNPFRVIQDGESDFYKFQVETGETYNITLNPITFYDPSTGYGYGYLGGSFFLYGFNQSKGFGFMNVSAPSVPQVFIGPMTYAGFAYIEVECQSGNCPYTLEIYPLQNP